MHFFRLNYWEESLSKLRDSSWQSHSPFIKRFADASPKEEKEKVYTSSFSFVHSIMLLVVIASSLTISGCCLKKKPDPLEKINRRIYILNKTADKLFIKPIACAYDKFLPKPYRYASHNFFQNIREIPTIINDLLQLKFKEARTATARFALNTTWGVLGLIDVASLGKIERHSNDFGLTMAYYGLKESTYIVLPILGPCTIRDAVGKYVDTYISIWPYLRPTRLSWTLYAINLVDTRAKLLQAEPIIEEAAVDEYTFMRDAYLQHRRYEMNMDKEPVVGDLNAADLPDDNETSSTDNKDKKPLASDMPDDNELLKKGDKDGKDKKTEEEKKAENDKPKVGAAAVAAVQTDEESRSILIPAFTIFPPADPLVTPANCSLTPQPTPANPHVTPILPWVTSYDALEKSYAPLNPEEIKGTSTVTDAVGGATSNTKR